MRDTKQQWFKDAKLGLFIHFGLYAMLAGEYDGRRTTGLAEWIMNDLDIPVDRYEALAAGFNPVHFDADALVRKAKDWGMRYITFTSKHHDGFAMYHSKCSGYNIVDASPYGRDMVAELAAACARHGLRLCLYYSQAQDWHHPDGYRARSDNTHKNYRRYLEEKCFPQIRELLTGYGPIGMIWFDTPMDTTQSESREMFDLVKSIQPDCIVSGRIGNALGEYMTTGDNAIPALPFYGDWEVPATLNDTWGYSRFDDHWKPYAQIVRLLVKINSRGGNYLLNVGPMADGSIPQPSLDTLDRLGAFLAQNGQSIYGTRAVDPYVYDMETVFFTATPHKVYLHLLAPRKALTLNNVANVIEKAYLLRDGTPVAWRTVQNCEGEPCWQFTLPDGVEPDPVDTVICVEITEEKPAFVPLT